MRRYLLAVVPNSSCGQFVSLHAFKEPADSLPHVGNGRLCEAYWLGQAVLMYAIEAELHLLRTQTLTLCSEILVEPQLASTPKYATGLSCERLGVFSGSVTRSRSLQHPCLH